MALLPAITAVLSVASILIVNGELSIRLGRYGQNNTIGNRMMLSGETLSLDAWLTDPERPEMEHPELMEHYEMSRLAPSLTFQNRSWRTVVAFANNTNETDLDVWHVDVPREDFAEASGVWLPKEQWTLTITLNSGDIQLSNTYVLLDKASDPIAQWNFGPEEAVAMETFQNAATLSIAQSPCAADVLIALLDSGLLAVTHTSFLSDGGQWVNVSRLLCQTLENIEGANCDPSPALDLRLSNHHVILLTARGVYVSRDMTAPPSNATSDGMTLTFTLATDSVSSDCDMISVRGASFSRGNFSEWLPWTASMVTQPERVKAITDLQYNVHTHSMATLYRQHDGTTAVEVRRLVGEEGKVKANAFFPPFTFPAASGVTSLRFHPLSHVLYAYGNQIWRSIDGGNRFELLYQSDQSDDVKHVVVGLVHDVTLAMTTNQSILYSHVGASRFVMVHHSTNHTPASALTVDTMGKVHHVWLNPALQRLEALEVDVEEGIKTFRQHLHRPLVPVMADDRDVVLYEWAGPDAGNLNPEVLSHNKGQVVSKSGGGAAIVVDVSSPGTLKEGFVTKIRALVTQPFVPEIVDGGAIYTRHIDITDWDKQGTAMLVLSPVANGTSGWTASHVTQTVVAPFQASFLVVNVLNATHAEARAPVYVTQVTRLSPRRWFIIDLGMADQVTTSWWLQEDECRHELSPGGAWNAHSLFELDIGDSMAFSASAQVLPPLRPYEQQLAFLAVSNTQLLDLRTAFRHAADPARQVLTLTAHMKHGHRGMTSLMMMIPAASLRCHVTSLQATVYGACPCHKRLVFYYPQSISLQDMLYGWPQTPENTDMLVRLEANHRPPSRLGVNIPTSAHIYNAHPDLPIPRNHFHISKESGGYKQCAGRANHSECGCTEAMTASDDAAVSDCKQRVYRIQHPGVLTPNLSIVQPERPEVFLEDNSYLVIISEINDRAPRFSRLSTSVLLDSVQSQWNSTDTEQYFDPAGIEILMVGSGLYHFRTELAPGSSFCRLYAEFQVFVVQTPIAYSLQYIIRFSVAFVLGGVVFGVYLWYLAHHHMHRVRHLGSQCIDVHDMPHHRGHYRPADYAAQLMD